MRIVVTFLIFILLAVASQNATAAPAAGDRLPPMQLTSAAGGTRPVWHRGRITIVTFCAFWCDTWKDQSRRLTATRGALRSLPVAWTMVSVDGRWADKAREAAWGELARSALLDTGGRWTERLAIRSVPTTLVVDETGRVRYATQGIERSQALGRVVRDLLAGAAADKTTAAPLHLVFDDFPSRDSRLDDLLLDALRAAGVRATFCGDSARRAASPTIVRRARAEGHTVRGPFGTPSRTVIDPFDFKRPGREELTRRILGGAAPGKTVLLHAGVRDTVAVLPEILEALRRRGFNIRPVADSIAVQE